LLFEHLSELEGDYEFDKISICCDWTEYKSIEAARKEYCVDGDLEDKSTIKYKVRFCIIQVFI
jgi:hypothetical protein